MFVDLLRAHDQHLPALTDAQITQLESHFRLLLKWNKVLNLSAVRTEGEIVERHFCQSLFLAARISSGVLSVVDVGSGGGFPGVAVAVLRPDCQVTLVESHQRKAVFLQEIARDLPNIEVHAGRLDTLKSGFDCASSRAVNLPDIWDWFRDHAGSGAFLTGESGMESLVGVEWDDPVKLPWGDHRFLRTCRNVARETSGILKLV